MKRRELSGVVAKQLQWAESKADEVLELFVNLLREELEGNKEIEIEGFGVFRLHKQEEYISVDELNNERYLIPPKVEILFEEYLGEEKCFGDPQVIEGQEEQCMICFDPDNQLLESVNGAFQYFEPVLLNDGVEFPGIPRVIKGDQEPKKESPSLHAGQTQPASHRATPNARSSQPVAHRAVPSHRAAPNARPIQAAELSAHLGKTVSTTTLQRKPTPLMMLVTGGVAIALASILLIKKRNM